MKQTLILMLTIFFLSSCTNKGDSEPDATTCTVKTMDYIENGKTEEKHFFTYNDKGRVIRIDHGTANSDNYETFDYQSGKIVKFDKFNAEGKSETVTFNLDANSRITSVGNSTFKYNTDGYLIESGELGSVLSNFSLNEYGVLTEFYGEKSKNLVVKDTFKSTGYPDDVTTYSYQKETDGKINSVKAAIKADTREMKFTYDCK